MSDSPTIDIFLHENKPERSLQQLFTALAPPATPLLTRKGTLLQFVTDEINYCYLLHQGHVVINRTKDELSLNSETAPFIFGFSMMSDNPCRLTLCTSEDAVLSRLPLDLAMGIIQQHALWEPLSHVMVYVSSRIFNHCTRMSQPGAYGTIRYLLFELSLESETVRKSESVVNYIQTRSFLSRSGIMAVLSTLRRGNYIEISNGKLLSINYLPTKF
ncbi:helix-turn-helix domain-containing protein [Citrobacter sp. S2-9]|uniref:Helix-turn-helix domain-containing protein n=1 Tax=Citrobacter enshiensis TaxID=2971264 RepID=A0ABT8PQZ7_9ENTR|nr:helix-turn-helix domain-containing protein [Citrobacter enshiensis]MDN8598756.1 helix-turn-helix domain-containing protein [Citrobacter enshiensis]